MGADRFYIQPVRRQHQELVPPWVRAQPHLIHRPVPKVPTVPETPEVIQGTAPGRGGWGCPRGQLWGEGQLSPMPGEPCKMPQP